MPAKANRKLSERLSAARTCKTNADLRTLINRATALGQLDATFQECLPSPLRNHIQLADVVGECLNLRCHSAALATRFRMQQDTIMQALKATSAFCQVKRISIRIKPVQTRAIQKSSTRSLSQENAQLLLEEAGHTKDQKLKAVLTRIAMRANPPS